MLGKKNKVVEVLEDCLGCSWCCEWVLLKVSTRLKVNKVCAHIGKKYKIIGDSREPDKKYFELHNIKINDLKRIKIYSFTADEIFYKKVGGELWFKVPIKCTKLNKSGWCSIHNKRPVACKVANCPLLDEDCDSKYKEGWSLIK